MTKDTETPGHSIPHTTFGPGSQGESQSEGPRNRKERRALAAAAEDWQKNPKGPTVQREDQ